MSSFQRYLVDAEKDKERYSKELESYHQTEAYKLFVKRQLNKKAKGLIYIVFILSYDEGHDLLSTSGIFTSASRECL